MKTLERLLIVLTIVLTSTFSIAQPTTLPDDSYRTLLKAHVDNNGMVDYKKLKAKANDLDKYLAKLATLDAKAFAKLNKQDKIALWINAYNALTLKAIISNYPIKWSYLRSIKYPKNSIRQIGGVWDKLKSDVMGRKMTLNDVEHNELRKKFNEPRIHMALVCAAMSCPPLRNEPFVGETLDKQLDDQTRRFLKNSARFRIDRKAKRVYLSPIFKWFGGDFVKSFGPNGSDERAALNFIARYLPENDKKYLAKGKYKVKYLDYDWTLNERKTR